MIDGFSTSFEVVRGGEPLGQVTVPVPGRHVALNSLAAIAVALEVGIPFEVAAGALRKFAGISRRFEIKHVYGAMGWAPADEVEEVLNKHLASRQYFLGDSFSALDILLGGGLHFLMMAKMVKETPALKSYAERITDRPAYRKMMQIDKG